MSATLHALKWVVYLIRWLLFATYSLLEFISKPGSRAIFAVLAAVAAFAARLPLDAAITSNLLDADWHNLPEPATFYRLAALGAVLVTCVFVTVAGAREFLFRAAQLTALLLVAASALAVALGYRGKDFDFSAYVPGDWHQAAMTALPDALLVLGVLLATCVYAATSMLLVLLLGAFPPVVRPLRPMRRLSVKGRAVRPVKVRLAVPKLPQRIRLPMLHVAHDHGLAVPKLPRHGGALMHRLSVDDSTGNPTP